MQSCNDEDFQSVKIKKRIPNKNKKPSSHVITSHQSQYHIVLFSVHQLDKPQDHKTSLGESANEHPSGCPERRRTTPRRYPIAHTSFTAVTTALTTAVSTRTDVVATTTRIRRIKIEKIPNSPGSHTRLKLMKIFLSGIQLKYLNIMAIVTDIIYVRMNFLKIHNWFSKSEFVENKDLFTKMINVKATAKETQKEKELDGEIILAIMQKTE